MSVLTETTPGRTRVPNATILGTIIVAGAIASTLIFIGLFADTEAVRTTNRLITTITVLGTFCDHGLTMTVGTGTSTPRHAGVPHSAGGLTVNVATTVTIALKVTAGLFLGTTTATIIHATFG